MAKKDSDSSLFSQPRPRVERLGKDHLRCWAPAKINLNLLVGPRRGDGFHPVDSFVSKITLYDQLELRLRDDGAITFESSGADCGPDEENLALRAARLLAETREIPGADIHLTKNIPPGKGLGGGSSNSAAVLQALNELWNLGLPRAELHAFAAELGSDVPLFLGSAASRVTGRGERVEPISVHPFYAVLCIPDASCNTAEVYRAYDRETVSMLPQLSPDPLSNQPPSQWRAHLQNQLSAAAMHAYPKLRDIWDKLTRAVGPPVCMTGTGSAVFVLCDDLDEARAVLEQIPEPLKRDCLLVQQNNW